MSDQIPEQYTFLFRLLSEYSAGYTEELTKLAADKEETWNLRTARFEVDAYFASRLSDSLLRHKHNHQVWVDMCYLCRDALAEIHQEYITSENLSDVIVARIEEYGRIANLASKLGDPPQVPWVKSLRQHIMASQHTDCVQAEHPLMIGSFFKETALFFDYVRIDLFFGGGFSCGLRHIFQRTTDVRKLPEEELTSLAQAGAREAAAIAARTLDSMLREPSAQPKRWWEFWR